MNHSMRVHIGKRLAYILHRLYGFIYWQPTTSGHETFERISRTKSYTATKQSGSSYVSATRGKRNESHS